MKLSDLPPIQGSVRVLPSHREPEDFLETCPCCGQTIDLRDLRELLWHATPGHDPLEMDS
jgi:hypothetical protein